MKKIIIIVAFLIVGCADRSYPVANNSTWKELSKSYGNSEYVCFTVLLLAKAEKGKALKFSITAWIDNKDNILLRMSKLGVDFMKASITHDGVMKILLSRSGEYLKTSVEELGKHINKDKNGGGFLKELKLICEEIKQGHLPISDSYKFVDNAYECDLKNDGKAIFTLAKGNTEVAQKTVFDKNNKKIISCQYFRQEKMDGALRAKKIVIKLPNNNGLYKMALKKFDILQFIKPSKLSLPPVNDDNKKISIDVFLEKLTQK